MKNRQYLAIDLKSFYASVECVERGFNPMTTHLVVADASRTEKTICLAVSPSLKSFGIPGRARLFQVLEKLKEINHQRQEKAPGRRLTGTSIDSTELSDNPSLGADIFIAPPQMAHYMEWSTRIYQVYLKYIAPEDIHVYSIDEVFMDVTSYLNTYRMSARELAKTIIQDVLASTGITATAGIGTNLFLCKAALDIGAKHVPPDADGVRIAQLDEQTYRQTLWSHRPLTDFWRVGRGYADKLARYGIFTMGDIARCSLGAPGDYYNEELLYRLFGVNAELLIDHAWGWEPCTIADIKAYRPKSTSLGSGQVLPCPYSSEKARLVVQEMADLLALDLVEKRLVTSQVVLTVGYDIENLADPVLRRKYQNALATDRYGRTIPRHAHGTANLPRQTSSSEEIVKATLQLYDSIIAGDLWIRRINLTATRLTEESAQKSQERTYEQLDLFTDYQALLEKEQKEQELQKRERKLQETMLEIKKKFGKNAILKGMNLQEGATAQDRNNKIGGHKA